MEIISIIPDHRIKATSVMVEITIKEYLTIARDIKDDNDYQRKKVIKSNVKEQLKSDLLEGCSIPPIVLAIKESSFNHKIDYKIFDDKKFVKEEFQNKNVIILDGLQRTYVMLEILDQFSNPKSDQKVYENFIQSKIRCEIYVGLSKLGILYRMLTLNTGQTTMSSRHLVEILYLDYLDIDLNGKKLISDKHDRAVNHDANEYKFKDVIDGYYSFIEGKEIPLSRGDILDNIQTLKELEQTDEEKENFKIFFEFYDDLLNKIISLSEGYVYSEDDHDSSEYRMAGAPFGKSALLFFKKSQALTGLGLAVFNIKKHRERTFDKIINDVKKITIAQKGGKEVFILFNKQFDYVKSKSKKIGNDQRFYFKIFFKHLFDPESNGYLKLDSSQDLAFKRIRERLEDSWD